MSYILDDYKIKNTNKSIAIELLTNPIKLYLRDSKFLHFAANLYFIWKSLLKVQLSVIQRIIENGEGRFQLQCLRFVYIHDITDGLLIENLREKIEKNQRVCYRF